MSRKFRVIVVDDEGYEWMNKEGDTLIVSVGDGIEHGIDNSEHLYKGSNDHLLLHNALMASKIINSEFRVEEKEQNTYSIPDKKIS